MENARFNIVFHNEYVESQSMYGNQTSTLSKFTVQILLQLGVSLEKKIITCLQITSFLLHHLFQVGH